MKCLCCGKDSDAFLCENCRTIKNLDLIFDDIVRYNDETCENSYIKEYATSLEKTYLVRNIASELFALFPDEKLDYYLCVYYAEARDERFEKIALQYLSENNLDKIRAQHVLFYLLDEYSRKFDMYSPAQWCEKVETSDNVLFDIYVRVIEYYSRIGKYEKAQAVLSKAIFTAISGPADKFFVFKQENAANKTDKLKNDLDRYKAGKPYWPTTEERRKIIAEFYDKKGITHPRITPKPTKIKESDFTPPRITYTVDENNYTTFWFDDAFTISKMRVAYSVAAVKVRDSVITDRFSSFINPNEGTATVKDAAKKAGVDADTIKNAPDIDLVMTDFFKFVGDDVLVTSEIGNQRRLLSRGARYTGMSTITNNIFSLDDLAEEMGIDETDRTALLNMFGLEEGTTSLEKAEINITLLKKINEYE